MLAAGTVFFSMKVEFHSNNQLMLTIIRYKYKIELQDVSLQQITQGNVLIKTKYIRKFSRFKVLEITSLRCYLFRSKEIRSLLMGF